MSDQAVERESLEKLGALLVERQALSPKGLVRALEKPAAGETAFLNGLVTSGDASEGAIVAFLAERSGFPGVDLSKSAFLLGVLDLIPRPVAENDQLLPLSTEGGRLHVAVISPSTVRDSIDEIRFITGMEISLYIALAGPLGKCIAASFDARERGDTIWRGSGLGHTAPARLAILHPSPVGPEATKAAAAISSPGVKPGPTVSTGAATGAAQPAPTASPAAVDATGAAKAETSAAQKEISSSARIDATGPAAEAGSAKEEATAKSEAAAKSEVAVEKKVAVEKEAVGSASPSGAGSGASPAAPAAKSGEVIVELSSDAEILEGELIEAELVEDDDPASVTPIHVAPVPASSPGMKAPPQAPPAPKAQPAMIEIEVGDDRSDAGAEEEEELVVSVHTGPKRILVVDDEPDIIRLCTRALQIKGYLVESAADGGLAEARLKKSPPPDLVLLDAMLPVVHGFEICQRIKSSKAMRGVQVVMMSAVYRGWRFAQDAKETYGADDFIEKPFHLADLLRRVDERLAEGKAEPPRRQSTEKLYRSGVEALAGGKAQEGRKALEAAAREDPFSPRIQFALGGALAAVGDTYRAISAYERAVELRPKLFPALKALAGLYLEKGFRKKAAETLERAFACAPDPKAREEIRVQLARLI